MLTKMLKFELSRLIRKRKLLWLAALGVIALLGGAVNYLGSGTPQRTSFEAFSFATGLILPLLLPLLAGLTTGDILAEDRQLGLQSLILSRGVSPFQYIFAKALGSIVGQICFMGGSLALFFVLIMPFFPVGPILEYTAYYGRDLAATNPGVYCLTVALIFVSAATAFSGIALLASVWVKNVFAVMVTPVVLYFAALYAIGTESLVAINPYVRLALLEFSVPLTLSGVLIYWVVISIVAHVLAVLAFSLKRDYA